MLFQRKRVWMNESENFARWRRFAAVTRIEWVDHLFRSGDAEEILWAPMAAFRKNFVVSESVMKMVFALALLRQTAIGSSALA